MKKNLLLLSLAGLAIASCTSDENLSENAGKSRLRFETPLMSTVRSLTFMVFSILAISTAGQLQQALKTSGLAEQFRQLKLQHILEVLQV